MEKVVVNVYNEQQVIDDDAQVVVIHDYRQFTKLHSLPDTVDWVAVHTVNDINDYDDDAVPPFKGLFESIGYYSCGDMATDYGEYFDIDYDKKPPRMFYYVGKYIENGDKRVVFSKRYPVYVGNVTLPDGSKTTEYIH